MLLDLCEEVKVIRRHSLVLMYLVTNFEYEMCCMTEEYTLMLLYYAIFSPFGSVIAFCTP